MGAIGLREGKMTILRFGSPGAGIWIILLCIVLSHLACAIEICRAVLSCGRVGVAVQALEVGKPLHPVGEGSPASVTVCTSHLAILPRACGDNTYHVLSLVLPSMPLWAVVHVEYRGRCQEEDQGVLALVRSVTEENELRQVTCVARCIREVRSSNGL